MVISCLDEDPCDILDLFPRESGDDLSDVDLMQVERLLGLTGKRWSRTLSRSISHSPGGWSGDQSQPELEEGFSSMELDLLEDKRV